MTIREARISRTISMREASVLLGITATRLSHLEADLAAPTPDERQRLTDFYGALEFTSEEEIAATRKALEEECALIEKVSDAIDKDAGARRSITGEIECPKCGGRIRYSVAFNGHRAVGCQNQCVGWIE